MARPEVTTRRLDLEGFPVLVREAGVGAGPPVLVLHGGPGMDSAAFFPDPAVWGPGLAALAEHHHVIAYDQRGCGGSGVPDVDQPLALSRHVDDVEAVRAALGLGPVAVLAHSFGTVLAILAALRHPGAIERLVLTGGAPTRSFVDGYRRAAAAELPEAARARLAALQAEPLTDAAMHERFALALPLYFHRDLTAGERDAVLAAARFSARVNRALAEALEAYDLTPALPHVAVPALVVYGARDRVVHPASQLEFRGRLPGARFVEFQESGHFPFLEEPGPFALAVRYFLRHGPRAAGAETPDRSPA